MGIKVTDLAIKAITKVGKKLDDSYSKQGKLGQAWGYYKIFRDLIDKNKSTGGFLKLGIKLSTDIVSQAMGVNLAANPYFAYHKAHIQALADALNAANNSKRALEAFNKAVKAADSTADIDDKLNDYKKRITEFGFQYLGFADVLSLSKDYKSGGAAGTAAQKTLTESGLTVDSFQEAENDLKAWRSNWAGLYFESLQLLAMAEVEVGAADEAMTRFNKILGTMMKGSNMSKVAGYATQQDMYWEQYERMTHPSAQKPEQAVLDPTLYAVRQRNKIDNVSQGLAEMCDFVLSKEVRDKNAASAAGAALTRMF